MTNAPENDVPESDALEQATPVGDVPEDPEPHLDDDVPEADAVEQAQAVPDADDDYAP